MTGKEVADFEAAQLLFGGSSQIAIDVLRVEPRLTVDGYDSIATDQRLTLGMVKARGVVCVARRSNRPPTTGVGKSVAVIDIAGRSEVQNHPWWASETDALPVSNELGEGLTGEGLAPLDG